MHKNIQTQGDESQFKFTQRDKRQETASKGLRLALKKTDAPKKPCGGRGLGRRGHDGRVTCSDEAVLAILHNRRVVSAEGGQCPD